ncbi:NXPE family member 1-like [Mercenaria mercenaria]|uniref:NXPE family member 1-like n=1 Tax=Mercenaria mercenaria TaxID=6596 RepID=UPI00234E72EC|nr:NXPE family member 1-like [Mercenaria mercenaria]XP_045192087.2 NXPE family member 1-like [Mercenaria mercenaria]
MDHTVKQLPLNLQTQKVVLLLCLLCALYIFIVYQVSNGERNSSSVNNPQPVNRINYRDDWSYNTSLGGELKVFKESVNKHKGSSSDDFIINNLLNEVISEEEALKYKPCTDPNLAANRTLSTLTILGSQNKAYDIGDKIYVQATLYDSYGRQKTTGGDHLRARISNAALNAFAPGVVYDLRNGSYTIVFEALWSGKSYISATIAYTREAITAQYRLTSAQFALRLILAKYKSQQYHEDAVCHPDDKHLLVKTKYKDVCNFTSLNSGMPWYCGKPLNPKLQCNDWTLVKHLLPKWPKSISICEKEILASRSHQVLKKTISVVVKEHAQYNGSKITNYYQPSISCSRYNTTKLWYEKYSTGFFINGRWNLRHCKGFHRANFQKCLRNKRLYLIGDSTTRQWYEDMLKRYNCTQYTEQWRYAKWKKPSGCKVASNNFTVILTTHCQPFYVGTFWIDPKYTLISIPKRLELIETNEEAIVLIHIFAHMVPFHQKYYRDKMKRIRAGVEKLLKRNSNVKIFIKMPHTYTSVHVDNGAINDFPGYIFSRIIVETFNGLYDKVVVLDNKDATISVASQSLHPHTFVVASMVDQMFSYICE